jgi:acetyl-CoA carboxylase biotin carboxyl carrier protein
MNQKELRELIEFLIEKDIAEFEFERGDTRVRVVRPGAPSHSAAMLPVPISVPAIQAAAAPSAGPAPSGSASATTAAEAAAAQADADVQIVKSPIVGTFYESPSPGSPAFVKEGDRISVGQVLCIVEAMKLMNEIESDYAGVIVKRFVTNGQPVEYGQQLYSVRPA